MLQEYEIESAEDIQDALKDLLGGTIKEMMEAKIDHHLGYKNPSDRIPMMPEMAIKRKPSTPVTEP